jgi:cobaltochelatase CobN
MKITCISTISSPSILEATHRIRKDHGIELDFRLWYPYQIENDEVDEDQIVRRLQGSDIVLLDIRGMGKANELAMRALKEGTGTCLNMMGPWSNLFEVTRLGALSGKEIVERTKAKMKKPGVPAPDPGSPRPSPAPKKAGEPSAPAFIMEAMLASSATPLTREDMANYSRSIDYWMHGGIENYSRLLLLLLRNYHGFSDLPVPDLPLKHPDYAIYHPDLGYFEDRDDYFKAVGYTADRPAIGIVFHGSMHLEQNITTVRGFIRTLADCTIIPIYANPENNLRSIEKYFLDGDRPMVDAIINLKWFRINGGPMGGDPELT